ncbi:MAG: regulatory protein RecX [Gammaproteobacteria bacterium]|nr:regulatory protein RecX [Gammaproteobacteria bacterium]
MSDLTLEKLAKLAKLKEFLASSSSSSGILIKARIQKDPGSSAGMTEYPDPNPHADSESYRLAKSYILRLLVRREYSIHEIKNKLEQKGYEESVITAIVAEFQNNNWQSDTRCATMWLKNGVYLGHGPNKILAQMYSKGVSQEMANHILKNLELSIENCDPSCFWQELAITVARKKFGENCQKNNFQIKAKIQRFLYNRGFETNHIHYVIKYL